MNKHAILTDYFPVPMALSRPITIFDVQHFLHEVQGFGRLVHGH